MRSTGKTARGTVPVLTVFILLLLSKAAICQDETQIGNVDAQQNQNIITVTYVLNGEDDDTFTITLLLKRENDPSYSYKPIFVSGDHGPGITPGRNKIVWDMSKEFPHGLPEAPDYVFAVGGEIEGSFWSSPWIYAGAGAVAAGVISAVVLSGGEEDASTGLLPDPVGRPPQIPTR